MNEASSNYQNEEEKNKKERVVQNQRAFVLRNEIGVYKRKTPNEELRAVSAELKAAEEALAAVQKKKARLQECNDSVSARAINNLCN